MANLEIKQSLLKHHWDQFPRVIRRMEEISHLAKSIYGFLLSRIWNEDSECNPTIQTIAKETGSSYSQIQRGLKELRKIGLLRSKRVGIPSRNEYRLLLPEWILEKYGDPKLKRDLSTRNENVVTGSNEIAAQIDLSKKIPISKEIESSSRKRTRCKNSIQEHFRKKRELESLRLKGMFIEEREIRKEALVRREESLQRIASKTGIPTEQLREELDR